MKKIIFTIFSLVAIFIGGVSVTVAQTAESDLQTSLTRMRQERQAFRDVKAQESNERKLASTEATKAKRREAEERRAEAERNMEDKRKTVLLNLIDVQIKHLDKTNERVQRMPNISDELKAQLKTEIESAKGVINEKKAEVQKAVGKAEIKSLAKEIKDLFKTRRDIVKKIVDAIHASRVSNAVKTAEKRSEVAKAKIKELQYTGADTAVLEENLVDADNNIAKAKQKTEEGVLDEANESLKNAYVNFQDMAKKMKNLK